MPIPTRHLRSDSPKPNPIWERQSRERKESKRKSIYAAITIGSILLGASSYRAYQLDLGGFRSHIVEPILEYLEIKPNQ